MEAPEDGHRPGREQVGKYRIFAEIGAGGMASVHIARLLGDAGFARTVAIKRPLSTLSRDPAFRQIAAKEAYLSSRVHHANVVATLDVVETGTELLVVMEYVHGEALSALLGASRARGERVPVGIAMAIVVDALRGLSAVHQARDERARSLGLIHRDVSPQNILCGADGLAKLGDFGLAKAADDVSSHSGREFKGKLRYASPEQIRIEPLSPLSDVYSMGVVAWELLVGARPYADLSPAQIVASLSKDPLPAVATLNPEIVPALGAVVGRALAREPHARFESAEAMAAEIESSIPLASNREIAVWVQALAGDALARREQCVMEAERQTTESRRGSEPAPASTVPVRSEASPRARLRAVAARSALPVFGLTAGVALAGLGARVFLPERAPRVEAPPVSSAVFAARSGQPVASLEPKRAVAPEAAPASPALEARENLVTVAAPPGQPARSLDCRPPFSLDREGVRHMKPGCR